MKYHYAKIRGLAIHKFLPWLFFLCVRVHNRRFLHAPGGHHVLSVRRADLFHQHRGLGLHEVRGGSSRSQHSHQPWGLWVWLDNVLPLSETRALLDLSVDYKASHPDVLRFGTLLVHRDHRVYMYVVYIWKWSSAHALGGVSGEASFITTDEQLQ